MKSPLFKNFFNNTNTNILTILPSNILNSASMNQKIPKEDIKEVKTSSMISIREKEKLEPETLPSSAQQIIPYPKLKIRVVNANNNNELDLIQITPNSISSSQGVCIKTKEKFTFGRIRPGGSATKNDYHLKDSTIGPRQFEIYFKENKFYIVENQKGTGLFMKIQEKILVDHDIIVSFCSSHLILQVENTNERLLQTNTNSKDKNIHIRFLQGLNQDLEKTFNSSEKNLIRIGRSKDVEVVYREESVSRIQCTLSFEGSDWILYDGQIAKGINKPSTNGLW